MPRACEQDAVHARTFAEIRGSQYRELREHGLPSPAAWEYPDNTCMYGVHLSFLSVAFGRDANGKKTFLSVRVPVVVRYQRAAVSHVEDRGYGAQEDRARLKLQLLVALQGFGSAGLPSSPQPRGNIKIIL